MKDAGLVVDPSSATSVVYNATSRQFFAAIQWHGVYSSSDGATWNRLNNQPGNLSPVSCPATPTTSSCLLYRGEFSVVPGRNEMYFWYVDENLGNYSVFPGNVSLSCATVGMPPLSSCTFTPSQVASGQGDTNVVLKVVTTAASASAKLTGTPHLLWYDLGLAVTGVLLTLGGVKKSRGRGKKAGGRLAILSALLGVLVACGGGSSGGSPGGGGVGAGHPGTTPGNYTITITGTVGSVTRTSEAVLTVK